MTSIIRSSVGAGATIALVAGLTTGAFVTVPAASAAITATGASTSVATSTTTSPVDAPTATPTAAPKPATSASSSATSVPSAAPATGSATGATGTSGTSGTTGATGTTSSTATGVGTDPSLAAQNSAGNHAMGSTIPATDAGAGSTARSSSLYKSNAVATAKAGLPGLDVSAYQPSINWSTVAANGAKFVYIKASEGTTYSSSTFQSQYNGAYSAGLVRGAYHFATPNTSSGAAQASYFVAHGGGWTNDGRTLPPLLDIEYGYNATCWGLSQSAMVSWIASFSNTVLAQTGIRPAIYSTTDWWTQCTGNSKSFSKNPLFIAHYTSAATPTPMPAGWPTYTIWQWADSGVFPGDQDVFNGSASSLALLARGGGTPIATPAATAASILAAGAVLADGHSISSSNKQYTLTLAAGNLILRGNGRPVWQTHTGGYPGSKATMQADGNFVVYSPAGKAIWNSRTSGTGSGGKLIVQATGDLQVVTANGIQWHNLAVGSDTLSAGSQLVAGQFLHDTTGLFQAMMQADGNFVVYIAGKAKWNSKTAVYRGSTLKLQTDGNFVLYDATGKARWKTSTARTGASNRLVMQSDGNLVLYSGTKAVWNSRTVVR